MLKTLTLIDAEAALDSGRLYARMGHNKHGEWSYWKLRRNGKTQTWKTRPSEYRIPVKGGLKACGAFCDHSPIGSKADAADFYVEPA